ncbi:MAG: D-tyrosyl-tRNA(Tyr) deacylase [Lentisphaerae bacterium GWF2_45_14]|nr:MAG: D-tyrosyl-tRNA(Tyr) deacylase [Lentisphaerae bacterium GWF2_45_14]
MRALIQRVSSGSVSINGKTEGEIGRGIVILLGITHDDTPKDAEYLADKCVNLRIFEDSEGKMNLSTLETKGDVLIISQFTLYGDASRGRRPSYTDAARPETAIPLYEKFITEVRKTGLKTETGRFGAEMLVDIKNNGPVTLLVES